MFVINNDQSEQQKTAGEICIGLLQEDSAYHVALLIGEEDEDHWRVRFVEFQNLTRSLLKDTVKFPEGLTKESLSQYGLEAEIDSEDDVESGDISLACVSNDGACALCERMMPTTLHHLIPKSEHRRRDESRSFLRGKENILVCCRPCHSCIHRAEKNSTLAAEYYTQELILSHPKINSFVAWVSKQSTARYTIKPRKK